jgi:plastocyanin
VQRKTAGVAGALILVLLGPAATAGAASSGVSIQNFSFQPSTVGVSVGDTVTWTQKDTGTQHTVTSDNGSFGSGNLLAGQTFAHTFNQPGTFSYHCNIHPSMMGTVTVAGSTPAPTQPPATSPAAPPVATTAAPARPTTLAPATTARSTTTTTTVASPTTLAPPAAADTTSTTTAAAGGGAVALPARKTSSGGGINPLVVVLAVVLAAGAGAGGLVLRRHAR